MCNIHTLQGTKTLIPRGDNRYIEMINFLNFVPIAIGVNLSYTYRLFFMKTALPLKHARASY